MNRSLALTFLVPLAAACSSGDDSGGPSDAVSVAISNFTFIDEEVHVSVGGSVTWTNGDDQAHTATSSGNFDAGSIDPARSSTLEFLTAGTFTYVCSFHPFMHGTVVVE